MKLSCILSLVVLLGVAAISSCGTESENGYGEAAEDIPFLESGLEKSGEGKESSPARNYDPGFVHDNADNWVITTLDEGCYLGDWLPNRAVVLDAAGYAHIVFGSKNFSHAWEDAGGWNIETVDGDAHDVDYTSLGQDASGNLHACYYDGVGDDLKYAKRVSRVWTTETINASGDVGKYCNIALNTAGTLISLIMMQRTAA